MIADDRHSTCIANRNQQFSLAPYSHHAKIKVRRHTDDGQPQRGSGCPPTIYFDNPLIVSTRWPKLRIPCAKDVFTSIRNVGNPPRSMAATLKAYATLLISAWEPSAPIVAAPAHYALSTGPTPANNWMTTADASARKFPRSIPGGIFGSPP